jgi:replicative DNA helicase
VRLVDRESFVAEKVTAQQERAVRARIREAEAKYLYARPPVEAAQQLIDLLTDTRARFHFGLEELDQAIDGIGRGELCFLTGRAHSGKTWFVQNALLNQPDLRVVMFSPDETPALIWSRFVSMLHGLNYVELGARLRAGDHKTKRLIWRIEEHVPNLRLCTRALTWAEMTSTVADYEQEWQAPCDAVVIDYLDLLPGTPDYHGTKRKSVELKDWTKTRDVATVALHQPNARTGRGQELGMDDLANAGQHEAIYVLSVFRKRDNRAADDTERYKHQDTISIHIDKNKKPPGMRGTWDYYMHPQTGRIRPLRMDDLYRPGVEIPDAHTAAQLHVIRGGAS